MSELLNRAEAAKIVGVSEDTLSRWVEAYGLPCIRINSRVVRFNRVALMAWLQSRQTVPRVMCHVPAGAPGKAVANG